LAIVWAAKHFQPYLYGAKFIKVTDHKPLIWLFNVTDPGSRLIRWRDKAGRANANTDALSRNIPVLSYELTEKPEKQYSEEEKQQILYEYHDAPTGGHQGVERTLKRIRLYHSWPGITKDVEKYVAKCELCQKNKLTRKLK